MPARIDNEELMRRVMRRVTVLDSGCWKWTGRLDASGYATYGKAGLVHRYLYRELVGEITTRGLDHFFCDQTWCVNPEHVRPASDRENILRSSNRAAANLAKTRCPSGHGYTEANTYVDPKGRRHCRACQRLAAARWYSRHGEVKMRA